jgi:glycosyltransferase involved in cell wall biosynthesis
MEKTMGRINLMIFLSTYRVGGFETRLGHLAEALDRSKFRLSVLRVTPAYKAKAVPDQVRKSYQARFRWKDVESREVIMRSRYDLSVIRRTAGVMAGNRTEVLLFFAVGPGTFIAPLAARKAGVPHVLRLGGTVFQGLYPGVLRIADRALVSLTERVIVPSLFLREEYRKHLHLSEGRVRAVPNGIDLERFRNPGDRKKIRRELGIPHGHRVIGMVANFVPVKGHTDLLHALPIVVGRFPETLLLLAGEGPLRQEMEALCRSLGIESRVRFLGYRPDVAPLLAALDVGVLCSRMETFGNAIIEMMAAGVPVVGTKVGGIPEVVGHEKTGLLVPPSDTDALAGAMIRLLEDGAFRNRLGETARKEAFRRFSKEAMVRDMEEAVLEVCRSGNGRNREGRMESVI